MKFRGREPLGALACIWLVNLLTPALKAETSAKHATEVKLARQAVESEEEAVGLPLVKTPLVSAKTSGQLRICWS